MSHRPSSSPRSKDPVEIERAEAWVGDAVLALAARRWILREDGKVDGAKQARLTSNQFLSACGNPTSVEARIGRIYEADGLEAAFAHIEETLFPLVEKQEKNRGRRR
ncbi:MAG: hypothetical protein KDM64_06855 [Verrucomicrobiae bacterium]|nr:hypothetical protein [Verrucomicrobiae bacterium]